MFLLLSFLNRERQMNGERQSLNTRQTSHLDCLSLILRFWTSVVLTKNSVWTLAQSVSNKWTQPKLKERKSKKQLSLFAISFSSFLTKSWILPFLLHIYLLKLWAKEEKDWSEHCAIRFNEFPLPYPLPQKIWSFFSTLLHLLQKMSTFVRKPK